MKRPEVPGRPNLSPTRRQARSSLRARGSLGARRTQRSGSIALVALVVVLVLGLFAASFLFLGASRRGPSTTMISASTRTVPTPGALLSASAECESVRVGDDGRWIVSVRMTQGESQGATSWTGFQASSAQVGYGPPYHQAELREGSALEDPAGKWKLPFTIEFALDPLPADPDQAGPPKLYFDATVQLDNETKTVPIDLYLTDLPR